MLNLSVHHLTSRLSRVKASSYRSKQISDPNCGGTQTHLSDRKQRFASIISCIIYTQITLYGYTSHFSRLSLKVNVKTHLKTYSQVWKCLEEVDAT
jgi:hypothetical protein